MTAEQRRFHGHDAKGVFYILEPTATGKSELAADVDAMRRRITDPVISVSVNRAVLGNPHDEVAA